MGLCCSRMEQSDEEVGYSITQFSYSKNFTGIWLLKNLLLQKLTFSLQIAREFRIFYGFFLKFSMIFLCKLIYGEVLLGIM